MGDNEMFSEGLLHVAFVGIPSNFSEKLDTQID